VFINTLDLEDRSTFSHDIAIIGAGMAGICLARELAHTDLSVCVLESGGEKPDAVTDSLNNGTATVYGPDGGNKSIDDYLHESRARYYGGTGNEWGGKCAYFDVHDFSARAWIPYSGWPFTYDCIEPYYDRACQLLRIPTLTGMKTSACGAVEKLNLQRNFSTSFRCFSGITGQPMSTAFQDFKYGLKDFDNISVYLHANIARLHLDKEGREVRTAEVRCVNSRQHSVTAKHFILASGGIENVRILLNSERSRPGGIGNQRDLVGRFFNGHGMFRYLDGLSQAPCQLSRLSNDSNLSLYIDKDPKKIQGVYNLTYKAQWRERIAQFAATLTSNLNESHDEQQSASDTLGVFFMIEQCPNPESRITLSNQLDALGIQTVALEWRFCENDLKTLEKGIELFIIESSRHHMGGTRMSTSSEYGVVDQNSKVHEVDNLFVAGSSVFPTGGIANPTLTILALTIRLADYVKKQF